MARVSSMRYTPRHEPDAWGGLVTGTWWSHLPGLDPAVLPPSRELADKICALVAAVHLIGVDTPQAAYSLGKVQPLADRFCRDWLRTRDALAAGNLDGWWRRLCLCMTVSNLPANTPAATVIQLASSMYRYAAPELTAAA